MKKYLFSILLFIFLCPMTAQAHEAYLDEIDWLTENDPSFSYADQFCEDYGIESYRELEQIIEVYYAAMDIGFESYSDMENAIIAENIIEDELGAETVDKLLSIQEKYGYGCIDKILEAVDEVGYGELTGDYSYINSSDAITTHSDETDKSANTEGISDKISNSPLWFLLIPAILIFWFAINRM